MTSIPLIHFFSGNLAEAEAQPAEAEVSGAPPGAQPTVIPGVDSLIGDLLDMDLGGPSMQQQQMFSGPSQTPLQSSGGMDLLGEGLDSLVCIISGLSIFFKCTSTSLFTGGTLR